MSMYPLIIFDLDGTLAESKQPITSEIASLVDRLLAKTSVAVISGGAFEQFLKQVVVRLPHSAKLSNLYLLPTSGAALYEHRTGAWKKIYEERLSEKEAHTIESTMRVVAEETGLIDFSESAWGERIEYRGGQVTLSALGQHAPLTLKKAWDADHAKRHLLQEVLAAKLPEFLVGIGGATSIDVTKRGIDKAYGLRQLCERLHLHEKDTLYVGDELEQGGNDEAIYKTEADTKSVKNPAETLMLIQTILTSA